jgi:hypothetical protein
LNLHPVVADRVIGIYLESQSYDQANDWSDEIISNASEFSREQPREQQCRILAGIGRNGELTGSFSIGSVINKLRQRLIHEGPVALHAVASARQLLLSSLADQDVVGKRSGAGADAEESIERRMPCAAAIEAEHELVQVVLKVCPSQAMVNAQAPALEV